MEADSCSRIMRIMQIMCFHEVGARGGARGSDRVILGILDQRMVRIQIELLGTILLKKHIIAYRSGLITRSCGITTGPSVEKDVFNARWISGTSSYLRAELVSKCPRF